jgi:septal ring factor EnvC (AmiA/AmiB activator)
MRNNIRSKVDTLQERNHKMMQDYYQLRDKVTELERTLTALSSWTDFAHDRINAVEGQTAREEQILAVTRS